MTLETQSNIVIYQGNSSSTNFPFSFPIPKDTIVVSLQNHDTGLFIRDLEAEEYVVSGFGNPAGGSVTYFPPEGPMPPSQDLIIQRIVPYTQQLDLLPAGGFAPEAVERQLDAIVMQIQQIAALILRAITVGPGQTVPDVAQLIALLENAEAIFPDIGPDDGGKAVVAKEDLTGYELIDIPGLDPYASQAEAEAGSITNRVMSPLRTKQALQKYSCWETVVNQEFGPATTFVFDNLDAFDFLNIRFRGRAVSGTAGVGKLELSSDNGITFIQTGYLFNFIYQDSTPALGGQNGTGAYILVVDAAGWSDTDTARCHIELEGFNKALQTSYESRTWAVSETGSIPAMRQAMGVQSAAAVHNAFRLVFSQQVVIQMVLEGKRG